jgi:predicted nucleic acid-binding protein
LITLDTSALVALLDRNEAYHEQVKAALLTDKGPYLVPTGILAEVCYFIEERLGQRTLDLFLADLQEGRFVPEPIEGDFARIRELVTRYADLPLGFADACVVACAERNDQNVLTLDVRHFGVVAAERTVRLCAV